MSRAPLLALWLVPALGFAGADGGGLELEAFAPALRAGAGVGVDGGTVEPQRELEEFSGARPASGDAGTPAFSGAGPVFGDRGSPAIEEFSGARPAPGDGGSPAIEEFSGARPASPGADGATSARGESPSLPSRGGVRIEGAVTLRAARDLVFERPPPGTVADAPDEPVVAGRSRAQLALEAEVVEDVRLRVEGVARWRASARRGWTHAKGEFEAELGEAYADFYSRWVDVRVGQQHLTFGANPAFAPADVLAPQDLRDASLLADPDGARLPVLAIRAQGEVLSRLDWRLVYVPFFVPHRYDVTGDDWALLQPGWGFGVPVGLALDPTVEGRWQARLLETRRPPDSGVHGDVGLRIGAELEWVELGVSWIWMNEKLPQVRVDPELAALLAAQQGGGELPPALLLSLQNRLAAGETLFSGTYRRQHLFSVEASRLVGPAQVDLDVTYSPAQTFVDERFRPVQKPVLGWALGATQAESSDWVWSLGWRGMAAFGVEADELLALIESGTARGADRTAFLHLLFGGVEYTSPRWPLAIQLRAVFEPVQRSFALAPQVRWTLQDRYTLWVGGEVWSGPSHSLLGYFDRNDQWVGGVDVRLF